jgi:hypothetical protein
MSGEPEALPVRPAQIITPKTGADCEAAPPPANPLHSSWRPES